MDIFTELAFDHIVDKTAADTFMVGGDSPLISGPNDLRPLDPKAPPLKLKDDVQGPLTDLTVAGHKETMHGELSRAFDNYLPSVSDWNKTIGQLLSANIERISGSSAASQALARHQGG
jgi:hypothetical protein